MRHWRDGFGGVFVVMPRIKLTDDQVREIRLNPRGLPDRKQAEKFKVHRNTIWLIRNGFQRAGVK